MPLIPCLRTCFIAPSPSTADVTAVWPPSPGLIESAPAGVINSMSPSQTDSSSTSTNPSPPYAYTLLSPASTKDLSCSVWSQLIRLASSESDSLYGPLKLRSVAVLVITHCLSFCVIPQTDRPE